MILLSLLHTRVDAYREAASFQVSKRSVGCFQSASDEFYIKDFLQEHLDDLSKDTHCWSHPGFDGLKDLLTRNITANPLANITLPTCPVFIKSGGHNFTVDLREDTYNINGVSEYVLIPLTFIHVGCMTLAFFIVYPIILMLASAASLCSLVNKPIYISKIHRWQTILQLGFLVPLGTIGLVCGICAIGSGKHLNTEHGISGLITVSLSAAAIPLFFIQKFLYKPTAVNEGSRLRKWLGYLDMAVCQLLLLASSFALPDGIDDLAVVTLCGTNEVSTSLAFSIGMGVAFVWNSAMVAMTIQWWLERRVNANEEGKTWTKRLTKVVRRQS
ncbi:hypothetical protein BS50DRAFT_574084 [Corynespora cassiicola Philippines]|uniref:Cytochrome b561 domain-containing protein n=1 Tax=Corynespora cassiicola Philippines TaxID=1448308 RepID=A0A2T2NPM7_CORCC|nr:hypothetical protein BS50DRAFT_574084 [Corynespora cassiicola Philippines]